MCSKAPRGLLREPDNPPKDGARHAPTEFHETKDHRRPADHRFAGKLAGERLDGSLSRRYTRGSLNSNGSTTALAAGLRYGDKGTHTSRTMMLTEVRVLFDRLCATSSRESHAAAIVGENCLSKDTVATRKLTNQRLGELYGLSPSIPLHRVHRRLWDLDPAGRPLLALLCCLARDPLLRATAPTVLSLPVGCELPRHSITRALRQTTGDRINEAILDKVARNAASSWTQSGHLEGRVRKLRRRVDPTFGPALLAVWLGAAEGLDGPRLLDSAWCRTLDRSPDALLDLVLQAKQRGLIRATVGGGVIDIDLAPLDPHPPVSPK